MKILKQLGAGAVSEAFLLEGERALLVGIREDSFEYYQSLAQKMSYVDGKITVAKIPGRIELIAPCKEYPFGALTEDFVGGVSLKSKINVLSEAEKEKIGQTLARFAKEMRGIDCDLDKEKEISVNLQKLEKSLSLLKGHATKEQYAKLEKVKGIYEKFMRKSKFCLTHGDLQEENIFLDENNEVSGIIDFANMEYYVSEVELAPMQGYDEIIFKSMLKNFGGEIDERNVLLVKLVRHIRHFKHIVNWGDTRIKAELERIISLLNSI